MMKSVILLLMILGVGGWVLSHSASYIAHRRAAHGPLTRDFFHGNSEIPPAFRQALEETIVFLDNRRDWAAGSALDAGTTDLCWIEIKDCDLLLRAGLFSPGNLGRLQIRRRLPLLPPGALPLSGSEAAQPDSFSPRRSSGVLPGRTGGHFRRPPVSPCGLLPSPWHSRALKGRGARSADRAPRSFNMGTVSPSPIGKVLACSLPLTETYVWSIIIHMFDFKGGRPHGPDGQADHPGGRRQV